MIKIKEANLASLRHYRRKVQPPSGHERRAGPAVVEVDFPGLDVAQEFGNTVDVGVMVPKKKPPTKDETSDKKDKLNEEVNKMKKLWYYNK